MAPPDLGGHLYSRQVAEAARLVATATGTGDHDLVWQSRSGPPQVPWLEPDIVDHLDALHARGIDAVVVVPVGFVSDHLEVVWDLDTEARDRAAELGMAFIRAATAGTDPRFVQMVRELVRERLDGAAPVRRGTEPLLGVGCNGELCAPRMLPAPRHGRAADRAGPARGPGVRAPADSHHLPRRVDSPTVLPGAPSRTGRRSRRYRARPPRPGGKMSA